MNEVVASVFVGLPFLVFIVAGMLEFQRDRQSLRSLTRSLPFAFAVVLSVLLLVDLWHPYFSLRGFSLRMTVLALLVPVFALSCRYRSRVASSLMFLAGLLLAFFWYVNRFVA
jgi:hypothetical protein